MKKIILLFICVTFITQTLNAQNKMKNKYNFSWLSNGELIKTIELTNIEKNKKANSVGIKGKFY